MYNNCCKNLYIKFWMVPELPSMEDWEILDFVKICMKKGIMSQMNYRFDE